MKKSILVTGSNGMIGSQLVKVLLDKADELDIEKIYCYDNLRYKQESLLTHCIDPRFEFVYGDVNDHKTLSKYLKLCNWAVPLGCIVGAPACQKEKELAYLTNTDHIKFICSQKNPDTKIIYCNTNSIFGQSPDGICDENAPKSIISHYADTKQQSEDYILKEGLNISLRLSTVMGFSPRFRRDLLVNSFVLEAKTRGYIVISEGNFMRSYVHILDVVSAIIHSIVNYDSMRGLPYNVSAEDLSKLELAKKIKEYIPKFVIVEDQYSKDIDARNYKIDSSRIRKTGWASKYTVDNAIQELIKGYEILLHSHSMTEYTNL